MLDRSRTLKTVERLEPFLVDGVALQEVLFEHSVCPSAEVHALLGLHTVADRDDHVEVVVLDLALDRPRALQTNYFKK